MKRFFFRPEEKQRDQVVLSETQSHHLRHVLRLRTGMRVELFDGSGRVFQAEVTEVGPRTRVRIISTGRVTESDTIPLTVAQGLLKAKHMDTVVQKCTELGVQGFIPLISTRCQGRPDALREGRKQERWAKIIEESCKQCRRARPMELRELMDFREAIDHLGSELTRLKLIFWEEEREVRLHDLFPAQGINSVSLLLGPEGGLTREEVSIAESAGWRPVSLGRRILRAETAALASVAIVQHLLGSI